MHCNRLTGAVLRLGVFAALATGFAGNAFAQYTTVLVDPVIPFDYDQGRNKSVLELPRPDYDPLGKRVGGFLVYPQVDIGISASNNIYLTQADRTGDAFATVHPAVNVQSDWNRNELRVFADVSFRRHFSQASLNRNEWNIRGLGRYDIGDYSNAKIEVQLSRQREEPFTSELDASTATRSTYRRIYMVARGEHQVGRSRFILSADVTNFKFSQLDFSNGTVVSQADRDRRLATLAGQAEYSMSPGAVLFGQVSYTDTNYDLAKLSTGDRNRDSDTQRVLGGMNVDLPGFLRGTIGVGYTWRNYSASIYRAVAGFSVQADVTYFYSRETNFKASARRVLQDSVIAGNSAFFDTLFSIGVDHETRRNIIVGATAAYGTQDYIDSQLRYRLVELNGYARYLMSRRIHVQLGGRYAQRDRVGDPVRSKVKEVVGMISLEFHE